MEQFIKDQVEKWMKRTGAYMPVITISAEPGSGGRIIAKQLSEQLKKDLFDRDIIKSIAESAKISAKVIETMEKERLSGIEDFISSLVDDRYLWPGVYLDHLMKVIAVIASHGNAVIVGRGANFIIPPEDRLSVRVIAPFKKRTENVVKEHGVSFEEARRRVINRENRRASFIKQSFNADVANPINYDLVINTGNMSIDAAKGAIIGMVVGSNEMTAKKCL